MGGSGLDRTVDFQKFCRSGLDRIQFLGIRIGLGLKNFTVCSSLPYVLTAQYLISSFDNNNNIGAMQWADHQWNAEWANNPTRLRIFIPDTGTTLRNDPPKKSLGLA